MQLEEYVRRHREWSSERFGPAPEAFFSDRPGEWAKDNRRTKGVVAHIKKELEEILKDPEDFDEWLDVIILAIDGYWRHGGKPEDLMASLIWKQGKNMRRTHPDWRTMSTDVAIEHDRSVKTD